MMEFTSALTGFSFTVSDLYRQVTECGWSVKKVKYDKKKDRFEATAKASHGEEITAWGRNEHQALVHLIYRITHLNSMRSSRVASWNHSFVDQLIPIAEAYSKAPIYEPKAATSFMALARDCIARAKVIREHIIVQVVNDPEPYKSPEKMYDDIRKRRQLIVSRAGTEHPIWSQEEMIAYRICHDVLGYAAVDSQWDWEGENRAFAAHAAIVPAEAQSALFTESIGQTAYATYYRAYGPQKIALFPQFIEKAQKGNNPHDGYRGIHPVKMLLPDQRPEAKPPHEAKTSARQYPVPMENGQLPVDINAGWKSQVMQGKVPPNFSYPQQYDPAVDDSALGLNEMGDMVGALNTGWADPLKGSTGHVAEEWQKYQETDPAGAQRIKTAVSNAIRVAALSPRTLLHQNAQHYQDLREVPYNETDPNRYWDALERARKQWNIARFGPQAAEEHRPWNQSPPTAKGMPKEPAPIVSLARLLYDRDATLGQQGAMEEAERKVFQMKSRFQQMLERDLEDKPESTDQDMWILDNEANKMVLRWIQQVTKPSTDHDEYQPSADENAPDYNSVLSNLFDPTEYGPGAEEKWVNAPKKQKNVGIRHVDFDPSFDGYENDKVINKSRYGAFMGTAMQTIARLTSHLDEIVVTCLEDVHDHDGSGHHFRTFMLSLNVPGVGPKIISFMWLLLHPLTSQLATIDVHMAKLLGYSEKDVTDREYYRMERELGARRDALGLNHVPLGQYQWACFLPGTLVRTRDGFKPIETIQVGEEVLSHTGRWNKVTSVMEKDYDGEILEIKTNASFNTIKVTPEHPFWVLHSDVHPTRKRGCSPGECARTVQGKRLNPEANHSLEWKMANDLKIGTYFPLIVDNEECDMTEIAVPTMDMRWISRDTTVFALDEDLLWFMGLYIAEGNTEKNRIQIALHQDEIEYQDRVLDFARKHGYNYDVTNCSDNGIKIRINSKILSLWFADLFGQGAYNKHIPNEFLRLPKHKLQALISGIYAGDGKKTTNSIEPTSLFLSLQLVEAAMRLGYEPTTAHYVYKRHNGETPVYRVHGINGLSHTGAYAHKPSTWRIWDKSLRKITKLEHSHYTGKVYNLEVENDNSYVVENVPVHNCWDMGRSGTADSNAKAQGQLFAPQLSAHQDHSFMRVLDPTPVSQVKILPKPAERNYNDPIMQATQQAADLEREHWNDTVARQFPSSEAVPTQPNWPGMTPQFIAKVGSTPWAIHPETGLQVFGQEGMTKVQHLRSLGLSLDDIWNKFPDGTVGAINA